MLNSNRFDEYTIILSDVTHRHIGQIVNIDTENVVCKNNMNSANEFSFTVYKNNDDIIEPYWDDITNLKYIYVKEENEYYQIKVDVNDTFPITKSITATSACECELSNSKLPSLEINTEDDIKRDDYEPTVLYNPNKPKFSLLDRALTKMPMYKIKHVDSSIANIQRTFSVKDGDIYTFFTSDVSEEIGCLFLFDSSTREISVYDLKTVCLDCGFRGEYEYNCPKCNSTNLKFYGEDTTIYVDSSNLTDSITLTVDTDNIKNCLKLEAGDDNMTAAIRAINPNGTDYIYCFSPQQKKDMSEKLVQKLDEYDALSDSLQDDYTKYSKEIYDCIDKITYYTSSMMPGREEDDSNSEKEITKLTVHNLSPLAISKFSKYTSVDTVNSALKNYCKVFINSGKFSIDVNNSSYVYSDSSKTGRWVGTITITNFSDDEDSSTTDSMTITVNDDYKTFIEQKVKKQISDDSKKEGSIFDVLPIEDPNEFAEALKLYCLNRLISFGDAIQNVLDIMMEEHISDPSNVLYKTFYSPYLKKLELCQNEMNARSDLIAEYEKNMEEYTQERQKIQDRLNFEDFIGEDLYAEFCLYKREDSYSNSNYISDDLDNSQILDKAREFFDSAKDEVYKSCMGTHTITCNLFNLLRIDDFDAIKDKFALGNWLRIKVDETIFRLRLMSYQKNSGSEENIDVEFSDISFSRYGYNSIQSIINSASSMAKSYGFVYKQMEKAKDTKTVVDDWYQNGIDITKNKIIGDANNINVQIDNHGLLGRRYDDITDSFSDNQLKLLNNGIYLTKDNWETVVEAIGQFYFRNPKDNEVYESYGINAEAIVGKLLLGENLGIYSDNANMTFDDSGLKITNGVNSFLVDPNSDVLLAITKGLQKLLYVDKEGGLHIGGDGSNLDLSNNDKITQIEQSIIVAVVDVDMEYYVSESASELIGGEWSTDAPKDIPTDKYVWSRQKTVLSDGTVKYSEETCITANVSSGVNGTSSYTYIRYSQYANGNPMTENPDENTVYMGVCATSSSTAPTSYSSYKWSRIKGADGQSPIVVNIVSSSGNMFINGEIGATLTAIVSKDGVDISNNYPDTSYSWSKVDKDGNLDMEWTENHKEFGRVIQISNVDIYQRSQFSCEVDL